MKKFKINNVFTVKKLIISIFMLGLVLGNPVSWEPQFPWQGGDLTIYYDAVEGALPDNASPVSIHLGYNGWINVTDHQMTTVGNGTWRYDMTVPTIATVLDFVFFDSQGNWDNNGAMGIDWHIQVSEPVFNVVFLEPFLEISYGDPRRSPIFIEPGDTIDLVVTAITFGPALDSLKIYHGDDLLAASDSDTLRTSFYTEGIAPGMQGFTAIASDSAGSLDTAGIYFMFNPPLNDQLLPTGVQCGINYTGDSTATLALFAPYKDFVYVIGDFNDWLVDESYLMNRYQPNADSTVWWLEINGLAPGTEYAFQYLVDGEIRIADPYTTKVLDKFNDGYIPDVTYPNLKPYPQGKTSDLVAVLETGQTAFEWTHSDSFSMAPKHELVIYEMLVRDFIEHHDYQTLIDTLDYLDRLGINAIELMPINEFEGNSSGWGYDPSFYFAPDKYYGTAEALKAFIDECHRRNIAVLMDIVLNHSNGHSPMVRLYWNSSMNRPAANNPWYRETHNFYNTVAHWGNDFDHESVHTETFVHRVTEYWLTEFNFDGFRFDFTKGFSNTYHPSSDEWGSLYDAQRIANLKRIADEVWEAKSTAVVIFEHLAENSEEIELANYGILLWGNTNYNYNEASMGWHSNGGSDFSWGYYSSRGWAEPHLVTYMESHDEERLMYKNLQYGNSSGGYDIQNLATAIERMKLAAGFFLTLPGPKMIWQFGERGYDVSINYGGRLGEKPPRWEYMQDSDRLRLYKTWQALLKLRRENEVFRSTATSVSLDLGRSDGLKRIRLSHSSMNVIILGNFGVTTQAITPNFYYAGTWYEYFSGDTALITGTSDPISLKPGELRIYTDQYLTPPEPGLLETDPLEIEIPIEFHLSQNYPNPFNPTTVIEFSLPTSVMTNLSIHDLLGREVVTLMNDRQFAGWHSITWNGRNQSGTPVAAGMYIYTLKTEQSTTSKKLILLR